MRARTKELRWPGLSVRQLVLKAKARTDRQRLQQQKLSFTEGLEQDTQLSISPTTIEITEKPGRFFPAWK